MVEVELTFGEQAAAAMVGVYRQLESVRKGRKDKIVSKESGYTIHINGAMAEQAVAKYLGVHWCNGVNTYSDPDILPNLQTKWRSQDDGDMYVPQNCNEEDIYVLVIGQAPAMRIVGWIGASDAKKFPLEAPGGWKPAFRVPQSELHPISTLPLK
jgi:hypothetical protein